MILDCDTRRMIVRLSWAADFSKNPYIIQSILLLLGPALLAASIYMVLGRLIKLLDADNLSIIGPKWLTKVFVTGDVLSFLAQSAGKFNSPYTLLRY